VVAQGKAGEPSFWPVSSAFSRDSRQLAYVATFEPERGKVIWQVRIVDLTVPVPTPRVIAEATTTAPGCGGWPFLLLDWTPDGQSIAVRRRIDDNTHHVAMMSTADGSVRVLKTMTGNLYSRAGFLSPDGTYLAAETTELQGTSCDAITRNISVISVADGIEVPLVDFPGDDRLMGWAPSGNAVLFTSSRGGDSALWMQPALEGRPVTQAVSVRPGFAPSRSLGLTASGSLYSLTEVTTEYRIKEAELDFSTGAFRSEPKDMPLAYTKSNRTPQWSPDGRWLAFVSDRSNSDRFLVVHSADTGSSRNLPFPP
jgi:Tol biopolymer transport system component